MSVVIVTQLAAVLVAVWVVSSTNFNLENKLPVPFYNHVIAWLSLGTHSAQVGLVFWRIPYSRVALCVVVLPASLVVLPFVFSTHPSVFLFNLFLSLAAPFTFLSISYVPHSFSLQLLFSQCVVSCPVYAAMRCCSTAR
jgi:hypothetical protein